MTTTTSSKLLYTISFNNIIVFKKFSTVAVVGNTSTPAFSFKSSCHPDISRSSIVSCSLDVPDVTESSRHALIETVDAENPGLTPHVVINDDDDVLREIVSVTESREVDKSTMILLDGNVNGFNSRIFIDCSAAHNFISDSFIKHNALPIFSITRVSVTVANEVTSYIDQAFLDFTE